MGILTDFLAPAGAAITDFASLEDAISSARDVGERGYAGSQQLGQQVRDDTRFRPFTVTTRTGQVDTTPTGGFSTALSPEQAALSGELFSQGRGFLTGLGDIDTTTQNLFNTLQGIRRPEIERQRLGLEERLFGQGRSGVRTNQFGGTPEQLALEKAIQEQQSADLFTARQQALGERAQQAQLGQGLLTSSYLPENQLLNFLRPAVTLSDIAGTGQRQGAQLQAFLGQSGLESLLGGETLASQLRREELGVLSDLLRDVGNTQGGLVGSLDGFLTSLLPDAIGNIFNPQAGQQTLQETLDMWGLS